MPKDYSHFFVQDDSPFERPPGFVLITIVHGIDSRNSQYKKKKETENNLTEVKPQKK